MNSKQYEELCRYALADKLGISVDDIRSVLVPNPLRRGLPQYKHQIDLYWETGDEVAAYLNIANAKWRGSDKVDQSDVMLLQQVRHDVMAHKALMLTNTDFTAGARAVAQDKGIGLNIVRPEFDYSSLPVGDASAIQDSIQAAARASARPIFVHQIEHKAFEFGEAPPATAPPRIEYATKIAPGASSGAPPRGRWNNKALGPGSRK